MKELNAYYKAIENLTKTFCKKYFKGVYRYKTRDWAGGEIGGVIEINDYWFNMKDIEEALKFEATKEQVLDYYDYCLDSRLKLESPVNFKNYLKYYRGFSK